MDLDYLEGNNSVTQYGTTEKVELKLDDAVGFSRQGDGTFSMVGDFYHSKNKNLSKWYNQNSLFNNELSKNYAIEEAVSRLEDQSFFCTENEEGRTSEDGLIRMTFNR